MRSLLLAGVLAASLPFLYAAKSSLGSDNSDAGALPVLAEAPHPQTHQHPHQTQGKSVVKSKPKPKPAPPHADEAQPNTMGLDFSKLRAPDPTPLIVPQPPVQREVITKIPEDTLGWADGKLHGAASILTIFIGLMTAMRGLAEFFKMLGGGLGVLAKLVPGNKTKVLLQLLSWTFLVLAWSVGAFSAGPPKTIQAPGLVPPASPPRA